MSIRASRRTGFTITEMLVAIGLIVVLLGLLLPALGGVWSTGSMTKSMTNFRSIGQWMGQYSSENRDTVLPSSFNYQKYVEAFSGQSVKVRSFPTPATGLRYAGTWSDILQTDVQPAVYATGPGENDYRYDSPDKWLYDTIGEADIQNPFRASSRNSRAAGDCTGGGAGGLPTPWGVGAGDQKGYPGFLAANDFFAAAPGMNEVAPEKFQFFSNGQIRFPDQSMYLVDSFYGETIEPSPEAFDTTPNADGCTETLQVDFRYGGGEIALMLFLDGHVDPQSRWIDLADLKTRGVRLQNLTGR